MKKMFLLAICCLILALVISPQNALAAEQQSAPTSTGLDYTKEIEIITNHLQTNYPDYRWRQQSVFSTMRISGNIPINVQGSSFPKSNVITAIQNTGIASSYGGCGPIAMMGILDYFARYLGYSEITDNPADNAHQIQLAEDVLEQVRTYEVGLITDKNTLTFPWDYVAAFNELIKNYDLEGHITAHYLDSTVHGGTKEQVMDIIESSVKTGLPVTMYLGTGSGKGAFAEHYVNVYSYETWVGVSDNQERMERTFLEARINGSSFDNSLYYADSEILSSGMRGIIWYTVNYDNAKTAVASDFAQEFVNKTTGQGQYFFYEKFASIACTSGYAFDTKRLRCSYIENQYLVLSANRSGAGQAYLEFNLPNEIKKISLGMSLWSSNEGLVAGDTIKILIPIYRPDGSISTWLNHIEIDIDGMSKLKSFQTDFEALFPKGTKDIRICVTKQQPSGDRNKGRVVLDNITFFFDN